MATLTQAAPQEEKEQSHRLRIGASFGLVYLFWGSTYLAIMIAVRHFPPPVLGALRFLIAGALMLGWCAFRRKKLAITRGDFLRLLLVGVLLLVGGNTVLAWAEEYINSGLAAMIVAVVPIWIAMIEALFGGDRLTRLGWSGLVRRFCVVGERARRAPRFQELGKRGHVLEVARHHRLGDHPLVDLRL